MKKKILIFHPYLAPYRIDLYNQLAKDFEIEVLLTGSKEEINTLGFDLSKVNEQAIFNLNYYQKGFRIGRHLLSGIYFRTIKKMRPDIVLAHELGFNTIIAIFLKKIFHYKLYITCDDSPAMAVSYKRLRNSLRTFVIKHLDGMLVVNPQVEIYLNEEYSYYDCKFHYFPIIQNDEVLKKKIEASKNKAKQLITNLQLENKKIILFVGRLEPMKSPDLLIKAFEQLQNTDTVLVIVGKGSMNNSLKQYIIDKKIKDVLLTGALNGDDLYAWYYLAHIFVLPSNFEPFGAVVNEALVAGCHTIVSDKVGSAALINTFNGSIFKVHDIHTLQCYLEKAIHNVPLTKQHQSLMSKTFNEYYSNLIHFFDL